MSSFVSRWVVSQRHRVGAADLDADGLRDGAIDRWIAEARRAYLERCRVLNETAKRSGLVLQVRNGALPSGSLFGRPTTVAVSTGVTEVFPTSFTIAFRLRTHGSTDDVVLNAACAVSLEDPATGEACELGDAIRDELIALEHGARHTN